MTPREFLDDCAARCVAVSVRDGRLVLETSEGRPARLARADAAGIEDQVIAMLLARGNVVPFRPRPVQRPVSNLKRDFRAALAAVRAEMARGDDDGDGAA